eukprot:1519191-Alexandrium_andersonii.AAC.1
MRCRPKSSNRRPTSARATRRPRLRPIGAKASTSGGEQASKCRPAKRAKSPTKTAGATATS